MEKLTALKMEVDEASRKFEECQDAYATSMYDFINREQEFTDRIQRVSTCICEGVFLAMSGCGTLGSVGVGDSE